VPRREARQDAAGEQLILRGGVYHHVAVDGAEHRDIVDACGGVGKQIRHFDAALAILFEGTPGAQQRGIGLHELVLRFAEFGGALLAVELVEERLRIEGVDVAGSTGHEEEDHRFRLGLVRHRRSFWREWIGTQLRGAGIAPEQKIGHGDGSEAAKCIGEKFTAIAGDSNMFRHRYHVS